MEELIFEQVWAGFPSPGESWRERPLRIQDYLVEHPDTTHYFRVRGHSMRDAGIVEGDVLVVDRALVASSGDMVVVSFSGRHLVKRLEYVGKQREHALLCSAHPDYSPIFVTEEMHVEIWGVVVAVVRRIKQRKRSPGQKDEQK